MSVTAARAKLPVWTLAFCCAAGVCVCGTGDNDRARWAVAVLESPDHDSCESLPNKNRDTEHTEITERCVFESAVRIRKVTTTKTWARGDVKMKSPCYIHVQRTEDDGFGLHTYRLYFVWRRHRRAVERATPKLEERVARCASCATLPLRVVGVRRAANEAHEEEALARGDREAAVAHLAAVTDGSAALRLHRQIGRLKEGAAALEVGRVGEQQVEREN